MPVIKSAKKKLRQDKKRTEKNELIESSLKIAIKKAKKAPTETNVRKATSLADKAAKKHVIHSNKASRIKSSLSRLSPKKLSPVGKKPTAKAIKTPAK